MTSVGRQASSSLSFRWKIFPHSCNVPRVSQPVSNHNGSSRDEKYNQSEGCEFKVSQAGEEAYSRILELCLKHSDYLRARGGQHGACQSQPDGHGYAHPRRFGVACHLGVELDLPSIGCGKSLFVGEHREPDARRGARTPLRYQGEVIGSG